MTTHRLRRRWIRWRLDHSPKVLRELLTEAVHHRNQNLEREGRICAAVADVMWKATPFGETEDGDVYAYIVPKGCMHRLIGVAQGNGAHVPVAFRNITN